MLPKSPPLPFTQRTCFVLPSSGSTCSSFELVFPPPKFVIRRSDPSKFDRYLKSSGPSSFDATASSHRSSKKCSSLFVVISKPQTPPIIPHTTSIRQLFPIRKYPERAIKTKKTGPRRVLSTWP